MTPPAAPSSSPQFYVKVGLYLGATALCELEETPPVSGDQVPRWNKTITFETLVQDLPLSGRLCMGVVGVSKRKKKEVSRHGVLG